MDMKRNLMNETQAVIFIRTEMPHRTDFVWERAEIDDYRDSDGWTEVGVCTYDTERMMIVEMQ